MVGRECVSGIIPKTSMLRQVLCLFIYLRQLLGSSSSEQELMRRLLSNYEARVRPVISGQSNTTTKVYVNMRYFVLLYMEQSEESITFSSDFEMTWTDPQLTWQPSDAGGLERLFISESTLWKPDIAIANGLGQTSVLDADSKLLDVLHTGRVLMSTPSVCTTRCKLEISAFPFDTQHCTIEIGSWFYTNNEMVMEGTDGGNNMYKGNSEWEVEKVAWTEEQSWQSEDGRYYNELHYHITLKRKASYYIFVLLLPTFIVTTLCICGLFSPTNNVGERAGKADLGLTTLLSLAVMLNIVGTDMPKSSKLPKLGVYVLVELVLCSVGVLLSLAIQFAHQRVNTRMMRLFWKKAEGKKEEDHIDPDPIETILIHLREWQAWEALLREWVIFYDRIDIACLILFQICNIIYTLVTIFA